jgi:hypothetical protein
MQLVVSAYSFVIVRVEPIHRMQQGRLCWKDIGRFEVYPGDENQAEASKDEQSGG